MEIFLKDPYTTLPKAGYEMCGKSNQFRRHTKIHQWFHVYVEHHEETIKIHTDVATNVSNPGQYYKQHKTVQRSYDIDKEIERIRLSEARSIFQKASQFMAYLKSISFTFTVAIDKDKK